MRLMICIDHIKSKSFYASMILLLANQRGMLNQLLIIAPTFNLRISDKKYELYFFIYIFLQKNFNREKNI
ncbi:unnamed protein product [Paramecium primaurelia]|uniref:Uncharacterized protein n=1 Tax=Paramecium primaurelia TaxID=5886 RepID=A0A8S1QNM7_PARPR|nr:unnamed protein product [Paramecium primaurelia]